ncbi:unnamed protein product, partial [Meganyctiphanes norvegica]
CHDGDKIREHGSTWFDCCMNKRCESGNIKEEFAKNKCCHDGEKIRENGSTWVDCCMNKRCESGNIKEEFAKNKCCNDTHFGTIREHEEEWNINSCSIKICLYGKISDKENLDK